MATGLRIWLKRVVIGLLVVLALPLIAYIVGLGLRLAEFVGYLVLLVGLPFFLWIIARAGYRIFVKPYFRAWHINHIRHNRLLQEAVDRGNDRD
jgi:hypothetical protein